MAFGRKAYLKSPRAAAPYWASIAHHHIQRFDANLYHPHRSLENESWPEPDAAALQNQLRRLARRLFGPLWQSPLQALALEQDTARIQQFYDRALAEIEPGQRYQYARPLAQAMQGFINEAEPTIRLSFQLQAREDGLSATFEAEWHPPEPEAGEDSPDITVDAEAPANSELKTLIQNAPAWIQYALSQNSVYARFVDTDQRPLLRQAYQRAVTGKTAFLHHELLAFIHRVQRHNQNVMRSLTDGTLFTPRDLRQGHTDLMPQLIQSPQYMDWQPMVDTLCNQLPRHTQRLIGDMQAKAEALYDVEDKAAKLEWLDQLRRLTREAIPYFSNTDVLLPLQTLNSHLARPFRSWLIRPLFEKVYDYRDLAMVCDDNVLNETFQKLVEISRQIQSPERSMYDPLVQSRAAYKASSLLNYIVNALITLPELIRQRRKPERLETNPFIFFKNRQARSHLQACLTAPPVPA
jgi:hypothetical protein